MSIGPNMCLFESILCMVAQTQRTSAWVAALKVVQLSQGWLTKMWQRGWEKSETWLALYISFDTYLKYFQHLHAGTPPCTQHKQAL